MEKYLKIIIPLSLLMLLLATAVAGFSYFEQLNSFDALWMTVTTVLTVGYGDLIPRTDAGRILAILLVPLCIVLFTYFMGVIIGLIVEFNISTAKRSKRMEKKIKRLNNHIIVCGLNPMSSIIIERIIQEKRDFVLIEADESRCEMLLDKYTIVIGDPCEDEVLKRAGIAKAEGLITTLSDAENVLIVLSAREMNPEIRISAGAERIESESKLIKAGADRVINPERIGGTRMALSILKPAAIEYMDRVFTADNENFRIEELLLTEGSKMAGKTIKSAELRSKYDISVLAIKRGGRFFASNLADMQLETNDVMVVFGKDETLQEFKSSSMSDGL